MRLSPRVPNPGTLQKMVLKIRLLAAGSDSGLTKLGIWASRLARAHILDVKQNPRCRPVGTSETIESLFLDKTSASNVITCICGRSVIKRVLNFRMWDMQTRL